MGDRTPLADLLRLDGTHVVVTGAAQGFGKAISMRLAEAGAHVHLVDRNAEEVRRASDDVGSSGRATAHVLDITDVEAVSDLFTDLPAGVPAGLVNNAGVFSNYLLEAMPPAEFERVLRVNVFGTYLMCQGFLRWVGSSRPAAIVNIASVDALASSAPGLSHYTTSKHAIAGLTRTLAMELAPRGIRVNAVCPGASITEGAQALIAEDPHEGISIADQWAGIEARTPLGHLVDPDDIARAVLFLAGPMSSSVTSVLLPVDAGILVQPLEGYVEAAP